jgi:hypothetical protein
MLFAYFQCDVILQKSILNEKDKSDNLVKQPIKIKLFSDTERSELENILPSKTIDIYENRFAAICHAKEAEEKRYSTSIKLITKKVKDIEERIEMNFFIIYYRCKLLVFIFTFFYNYIIHYIIIIILYFCLFKFSIF